MAVTFGSQGLTVRAAGTGVGPTGPTGPQGASGQGFIIAQVYNSVAELLAGSVPDGQFGLVAGTLSQSSEDYGKLYLYSGGVWAYQTDMSVQGIQGPAGTNGTNGLGYSGLTSTSLVTIATGSKSFTTNLSATATAFVVGERVRVASSANTANWMEGSITAFSGTSMTVNVDVIGGSGTIALWTISAAGARGATGATGSSYYDIAISYSGTPTANEEILRHRVARAFTMPATDHKGSCGTNPGSTTGFAVRKNGSTIGTVTFATNGTVTLTSFVATSFAADDIITVVAPASLNSIANIGITLIGTI